MDIDIDIDIEKVKRENLIRIKRDNFIRILQKPSSEMKAILNSKKGPKKSIEDGDKIIIDSNVKRLTQLLGYSFKQNKEYEKFYLDIAKEAGLHIWEMKRLLYHFSRMFIDIFFPEYLVSKEKEASIRATQINILENSTLVGRWESVLNDSITKGSQSQKWHHRITDRITEMFYVDWSLKKICLDFPESYPPIIDSDNPYIDRNAITDFIKNYIQNFKKKLNRLDDYLNQYETVTFNPKLFPTYSESELIGKSFVFLPDSCKGRLQEWQTNKSIRQIITDKECENYSINTLKKIEVKNIREKEFVSDKVIFKFKDNYQIEIFIHDCHISGILTLLDILNNARSLYINKCLFIKDFSTSLTFSTFYTYSSDKQKSYHSTKDLHHLYLKDFVTIFKHPFSLPIFKVTDIIPNFLESNLCVSELIFCLETFSGQRLFANLNMSDTFTSNIFSTNFSGYFKPIKFQDTFHIDETLDNEDIDYESKIHLKELVINEWYNCYSQNIENPFFCKLKIINMSTLDDEKSKKALLENELPESCAIFQVQFVLSNQEKQHCLLSNILDSLVLLDQDNVEFSHLKNNSISGREKYELKPNIPVKITVNYTLPLEKYIHKIEYLASETHSYPILDLNDYCLGVRNGKIKKAKLPEDIYKGEFKLEEYYIPFEMIVEYNVQNSLPPFYAIVQLLPIFFECYASIKKEMKLNFVSENRFVNEMTDPSFLLNFLKQFKDVLIPWWL